MGTPTSRKRKYGHPGRLGEGEHRRPTADLRSKLTTGSTTHTRKVVGLAGNTMGVLAMLTAAGSVVWLLRLTSGGGSISSIFADDVAGTRTMSFPTLMTLLSVACFTFGQFAVRGRWEDGPGSSPKARSFRVVLRPISPGLHAVFLMFAVIAWALVMPLPVFLDLQGLINPPDGSSAAEQFWFTVTIYGVVTGALATMVGVSLIKKLTYNPRLAAGRSGIVEGSSTQQRWLRFSHVYRSELGIAGLAGAALGLSPLGAHLGSAAYSFSTLAAGVLLLSVAVATALNSWRSGQPVERVESYT